MVLVMLFKRETFCHHTVTKSDFTEWFMHAKDHCPLYTAVALQKWKLFVFRNFSFCQSPILHCLLGRLLFMTCCVNISTFCPFFFFLVYWSVWTLHSGKCYQLRCLIHGGMNSARFCLLLSSFYVRGHSSCLFVSRSIGATAFFTVVGLMVSHNIIIDYFC